MTIDNTKLVEQHLKPHTTVAQAMWHGWHLALLQHAPTYQDHLAKDLTNADHMLMIGRAYADLLDMGLAGDSNSPALRQAIDNLIAILEMSKTGR